MQRASQSHITTYLGVEVVQVDFINLFILMGPQWNDTPFETVSSPSQEMFKYHLKGSALSFATDIFNSMY